MVLVLQLGQLPAVLFGAFDLVKKPMVRQVGVLGGRQTLKAPLEADLGEEEVSLRLILPASRLLLYVHQKTFQLLLRFEGPHIRVLAVFTRERF